MALYAAPNCLSPQFATAAGDQFGWKSGLRSRCVPVTWLFNNFEYQFPDSSFKAGWRDAVCYESSCAPDGAPSRLGRRRGEGGCLFVFCALVSVVCCGRGRPCAIFASLPPACSHFLSHTLSLHIPSSSDIQNQRRHAAAQHPRRDGPVPARGHRRPRARAARPLQVGHHRALPAGRLQRLRDARLRAVVRRRRRVRAGRRVPLQPHVYGAAVRAAADAVGGVHHL